MGGVQRCGVTCVALRPFRWRLKGRQSGVDARIGSRAARPATSATFLVLGSDTSDFGQGSVGLADRVSRRSIGLECYLTRGWTKYRVASLAYNWWDLLQ